MKSSRGKGSKDKRREFRNKMMKIRRKNYYKILRRKSKNWENNRNQKKID